MSKLDRLIAELCPDGVEYMKLGDVIAYEQPTKYIVSSTEYNDNYKTPVLTAGQSFILGYTNETEGLYKASKESPVIIFDDFTTSFHWVEFVFKVKSSALKMLTPRNTNTAVFRYLFYALCTIHYQPDFSKHERQWIGKYSQFRIPLPPLPVQSEIVRILDNFTELTARKKQYEYYRNELLTFGDDVPMVSLGEISLSSSTGVTPKADNPDYYGGDIPWLRTQEVRFVDIFDTEIRVTEKAFNETSLKWIPADCVIVAISGAAAGIIGINKIPLTTNQHCCCFEINRDKALYRFVFHYLSKANEDLLRLKQGARGDLNTGLIKRFTIPLPSLEEQVRIVAILDKFDALTTDITAGLPAEITARQKQYEYYCDKLLTFKEVRP